MEYKTMNMSCADMSGGELQDDHMNMIMDDLRRGPWTVEEDFALINYITHHGEGRWNSLARCAGLKRTGKSCRLRWLNYLRPDVRRGNITLQEQLLILELHARWGNRWSKIAQHLPGRTDNEIKNYWRTRVQKHAKQLKCDVNSKQFKDTMRYLWMPLLAERIKAAASTTTTTTTGDSSSSTSSYPNNRDDASQLSVTNTVITGATAVSKLSADCYYPICQTQINQDFFQLADNPINSDGFNGPLISPCGYFSREMDDFLTMEDNNQWPAGNGAEFSDSLWNVEDILFLNSPTSPNDPKLYQV